MNCFLCQKPTHLARSLTQLTAAPATPNDSVPICRACNDDWTFSLLQNLNADLAFINKSPPGLLIFARSNNLTQ